MDKFPPAVYKGATLKLARAVVDEVLDPEFILSRESGQQLSKGADNGVLLSGMVPRSAFPPAGDLCDWTVDAPGRTSVNLSKVYSDLESASGLRVESTPLPMATTAAAGFMSALDKEALENLRTAVDLLQGKTSRIDAYAFTFDVFSDDPTERAAQEAELTGHAEDRLGTDVPDNLSIRNLNGGHVFRYNANGAYWIDDGYDVVGIATAQIAGLVKAGDGTSGSVVVDADGDMAVAGWSGVELVARKRSSFQGNPDNTSYPTEKLVYDSLALKENLGNKVSFVDGTSNDAQYPTARAVHNAVSGKEDSANKTQTVDQNSTDTQYPSAKTVYDALALKENVSNKVASLGPGSTNAQYPGAKLVYDALQGKEDVSNKLLSAAGLSAQSTDVQYPSGKTVWDALQAREATANKVTSVTASSTDAQYPSAKAVHDALASVSKSVMPVGTVIHFYGTTAPAGWLPCDGSFFSPVSYPLLHALLGTDRTPDMRGLFVRGYDPTGVVDPDGASRTLGSVQEDELKSHGHVSEPIPRDRGPGNLGNAVWGDEIYYGTNQLTILPTGGPETRPRNMSLLFCIKAD